MSVFVSDRIQRGYSIQEPIVLFSLHFDKHMDHKFEAIPNKANNQILFYFVIFTFGGFLFSLPWQLMLFFLAPLAIIFVFQQNESKGFLFVDDNIAGQRKWLTGHSTPISNIMSVRYHEGRTPKRRRIIRYIDVSMKDGKKVTYRVTNYSESDIRNWIGIVNSRIHNKT